MVTYPKQPVEKNGIVEPIRQQVDLFFISLEGWTEVTLGTG